jgi:hypothetical protein
MRCIPVLFAFTEADHWRPGIGDPTFIGWLTVVAYFVAMILSFQTAKRAAVVKRDGRQFIFWSILCVSMLLLGINKQLDLQTWVTLEGRQLALSGGWYNHRRPLQLIFILFVTLVGMTGYFTMSWLVQRHRKELRLPLMGFFFVICFVIVRAASFHHIDQFLKFDIGGIRMNWVLELGGICLVIVGAWHPRWRARTEIRPRVMREARLR